MIKKLFNITIITTSILAITIASFSYTLFAEDNVKYNYDNTNVVSNSNSYNNNKNLINNKDIKKVASSIGSQSFNIINTRYIYAGNSDLLNLYNNASFTTFNDTSGIKSSSVKNENYPSYYCVTTFNPDNFDGSDAFVSFELIPFVCYMLNGGAPVGVNQTYLSYSALENCLTTYTILQNGGGYIGADTLLSGFYSTFNEIRAQGYTRGSTTDFYWRKNESNTSKHFYLTEYYIAGYIIDNTIETNNYSSNIQRSYAFDRIDIPFLNYSNNWTYAEFNEYLYGQYIYEKSDNIQITSVVSGNNGYNTYNFRVYNNGNPAYVTILKQIEYYAIIDNTISTINKSFTFYNDPNNNITDYNQLLNSINNNISNIYTSVDQIHNSVGTIDVNVDDIAGATFGMYDLLFDIKDLISDLQVTEINNVYNDIVNNYNIDIDNEINNYIDELKLNLVDLDINNPKFSLPLGLNTQLTGLKDSFSNIFTCFDNSGGSIFYIVPIVALIIGALL